MFTDALWSTFTLLFADLLLSHKLLRNDLYTSRVDNAFLAVRVGTACPGVQPSGLFSHYFLSTSFFFLSVISNRHPQHMLHAFSLPCACCPISSCSSGMHIHHMEEHACSSNTSHKASATFLQHGVKHLPGALKQLPTAFFSVALPDIALPGFTSLEFLSAQFVFMTQRKHTSFFPFSPAWIKREK